MTFLAERIPLATPRLFWLLLVGLVLVLSGAAAPALLRLGLLFDAVVLAAYMGDRLLLTPSAALDVARRPPDILSLGQWHAVELQVTHRGWRPMRLVIRDQPPLHFAVDPDELLTRIPEHSAQTLTYRVRSVVRGAADFGTVTLRAIGPLGLAMRQQAFDLSETVQVFPDITAMARYDLALRRGALAQFGLRPSRARGEGREFDRLREYVVGDDYRHIDWKATAKRAAPISREYETERSQRIMIVLDAGRLMTARVGEFTKLDYAINAALLLAHVAMHHGDQVGVLVFSDQVDAYLPARRGTLHLASLIDRVASVQPRLLESNYTAAFQYLALKNRRRTLVATFTDVIEPQASAALTTQMLRLAPHHLPLAVTMRDADVDRVLDAPIRRLHDVYRRVAADEVREAYETVIARLSRGGALTVNVPADALSIATVNRYLEIKARGRL